jgi:hypothetical protein
VAAASGLLGTIYIAAGAAPGLITFALAMLVLSVISGVSDILMNARISETELALDRPLMNLNHAVFSFAYAGSALATGWAREAGWPPAAVFAAIAAATLMLCPLMRAPHRLEVSGTEGTGSLPRGVVWIGGLVVLAAFFTESAVEGWSALHIERGLGGDASQGAMGPAILGLTMGFGRLFGQALARHVRDTAMISLACALSACGIVAAALAPSPVLAYAGFGVTGLGVSVIVPLALGLVGRSVRPELRVRSIGRASAIGYVAFLVGPAMMGGISEAASLVAAFVVNAVLMAGVAIVLGPLLARRIASAGVEP